MVAYFGIGICLLLILLLASKSGKTLADKILLVWLFLIACHLTLYVFSIQPITANNVHWLLGTSLPFPMLHGPMLYLYTAAMTNQLPRNRNWILVHFIPALVVVLFFFPVLLRSAEGKLAFIRSGGEGYQTANLLRIILLQVSGFVYVLWALWLLHRHKLNISQEFSYEERINLNWLRYFIYGLAGIWLIIVVTKSDYYIFGGAALFIVFLGYFGIRQVGIFTTANLYPTAPVPVIPAPVEVIENNPRRKYASSGVTGEMSREIHQRLVQLMQDEKLYTEPDLSLSILADKINVHPNYLSQVINELEGKTFFEYINSLRVEEFKRLAALPESRQFTIMSLAYDCGFNSKSSFNKNFKKATGLSPSEFLACIADTGDSI
ncbi:MAG: AraC family transcriptional regulator [Flavipsychrobacter sp.]|nr:AraC family transcriptional regulator [Flavipsychrobacter sp.]